MAGYPCCCVKAPSCDSCLAHVPILPVIFGGTFTKTGGIACPNFHLFSSTLFEQVYRGRNGQGNCFWDIDSGLCPSVDGDWKVRTILLEGPPLRFSVNIYSYLGNSEFQGLVIITDDQCGDELSGTLNEIGFMGHVSGGTFTLNPP